LGSFLLTRNISFQEVLIPHITLYFAEYPVKNKDKIIESVKTAVSGISPLELKVLRKQFFMDYLMLHFQRTKAIGDIHQRLLKSLNPLREGHLRDKFFDEKILVRYDPTGLNNIKQYGNAFVGKEYSPHFSFVKTDSSPAQKLADELLELIDWDIEKFTCSSIIVFNTIKPGGSYEILAKFELK
jgi:2'-5' RNA ligase